MEARVELEQNDDEYPSIISSYGNSMTIGNVEKKYFIIGFIIIFYSSINMIIFFIIPIYRLQKNKSEFPNASYKTIEKRIIVIHFILHTFGILSGLFTILYNFTENLSKCNSIFFGLIMFCSLVALSLWIVEILFGFIYTTKYKSTITFDQLTRIMAELRENSFIFIYTKGVDHSFICSKSCSLVETTCYSKKGVVFPLKLYLNSTNNDLKLLPKVFDLSIVQEIKMSNEIKDHFQNVMNSINNCDSHNEKAFDFYPSISGDYIVSDGKMPIYLNRATRIASIIFGVGIYYELNYKSIPHITLKQSLFGDVSHSIEYNDITLSFNCNEYGKCSEFNKKPKP